MRYFKTAPSAVHYLPELGKHLQKQLWMSIPLNIRQGAKKCSYREKRPSKEPKHLSHTIVPRENSLQRMSNTRIRSSLGRCRKILEFPLTLMQIALRSNAI